MSSVETPQIPDEIQSERPVTKLVYLVLADLERANTVELATHTGLPPRSVNNGIGALGDRVVSMKDPEDGRRYLHILENKT